MQDETVYRRIDRSRSRSARATTLERRAVRRLKYATEFEL